MLERLKALGILGLAFAIGCGARNGLDVEGGWGGGHAAPPSSSTATASSTDSTGSAMAGTGGAAHDCPPPASQTTLPTGGDGPDALVMLDGTLFFRTNHAVRKVSKCGGAVTTVAETHGGFDLAASPRGVFWDTYADGSTTAQLVWNPAGQDSTIVLQSVTQASGELWRPTADSAYAYWVLRPHGGNLGGVMRTSLDEVPPSAETVLPLDANFGYVGPLAPFGEFLYFKRGDFDSSSGPLMVLAKDGSSSDYVDFGPLPERMVVDATGVYMTFAHSIDEVRHFDPATSNWTVLASGLDSPLGIAVDETNVYFTESQGLSANRVSWVPKAGGLVHILLQGQADPRAVALDADSVYFTNRGEDTIVRVPKPSVN